MPRDKVFISYRRSDAAGATTALRQSLVDRFGEGAIFNDVTGIDPGASFPDALRDELARAAAVLAVIGKDWLLATNEWNQRRIDLPGDWVTVELSTALGDPEVSVIPVFIGDAPMPPGAALPASLRSLAARNAVRLRHDDWDASLGRLFGKLAEVLGDDGESAGAVSAGDATPSLAEIRRVVAEAVRQGVREALEAAGQPASRDLVGALTEIAALVPADAEAEPATADAAAVQSALEKLLGQPAADVTEQAATLYAHTFSHRTADGVWVGFSADQRSFALDDVDSYTGCLLLLPDARGRVSGAVALGAVIHIYAPEIQGFPGDLRAIVAQAGRAPGQMLRQL